MKEDTTSEGRKRSRHISIFPGLWGPSIFDVYELNCCVRKGNRWDLIANSTGMVTGIRKKTQKPEN